MQEFGFDRSKPFYPYVINYIVSLHGLVELFSRYCYRNIKNSKIGGLTLEQVIEQQEAEESQQTEFIKEVYSKDLIPTLVPGKFALRSEKKNTSVEISVDDFAVELVDNHPYLLPFQLKASGTLLVMAHHVSKHLDNRNDVLWNFFYHCRNAAAHGGQFNITNPRFPAKWGDLEITMAMNGTNLFKDGTNPGLLSPADPLYFLFDIESIYF